ncbi:MAG: hypothetical protein H0V18_12580 [Pyrinomonadaceae bacterium]|nr:hypothetical protein [Pyrinomonadaceae bacterium]
MSPSRPIREAIHEVLIRLEQAGSLTPDAIIEEAQKADSPLHGEFTWDIEKAALITWRDQARRLISSFSIQLKVHRKEYRVQEFVELPGKELRTQGYISINTIKGKKELAAEFLEDQLKVASAYVVKTTDYAAVLGLRKRTEGIVQEIASLREDARGRVRREERPALIAPVAP